MKSQWNELYHLIFNKHSLKLKNLTAPLKDQLGVTFFGHHSINDCGDYAVFSNRPDWGERYISEKMHENDPFLCAPSEYHTGLSPFEQGEDLSIQWGKMQICEGLIFVEKGPASVEFSFFGGPSLQGQFTKFLLNHSSLLKSYISHFKKETNALGKIQQERGFRLSFQKRKQLLIPHMDREQRLAFLSATGYKNAVKKFLTLSPQEINCLKGLHQGKTAKEIAALLALSPRTVEFYIDNVRNKMDCSTKQELLIQTEFLTVIDTV